MNHTISFSGNSWYLIATVVYSHILQEISADLSDYYTHVTDKKSHANSILRFTSCWLRWRLRAKQAGSAPSYNYAVSRFSYESEIHLVIIYKMERSY